MGERRVSKRRCRHDRLRGIYGDEINACGGSRSQCLTCGRWFDDLPAQRPDHMKCDIPGTPETVASGCVLWLGHPGRCIWFTDFDRTPPTPSPSPKGDEG